MSMTGPKSASELHLESIRSDRRAKGPSGHDRIWNARRGRGSYSPVNGELRIFYGKDDKGYTWEDSTGYLLNEGDNTIFAKILYDKNLKKVRIDPIDKNMNCIIEKIEIYSLLNN